MKPATIAALLFIFLIIPGFAHAAVSQCCPTPAVTNMEGAACPHPVAVTTIVGYQSVFTGPKTGWLKVPVYGEQLTCCQVVH